MRAAGFELHPERPQPGSWIGAAGIAVDLMVPDALAGGGGTRGVRVPPHWNHAMRRAVGLEAALLDRSKMRVSSLDETDTRIFETWVAGPAALLVSKRHKLSERESQPSRLVDKDAHDIYRLLVAIETRELAGTFAWLRHDELAGAVTREGLLNLKRLFASGPAALGSMMAGRAEKDIGAPEVVSAAVAALAADLLAALEPA